MSLRKLLGQELRPGSARPLPMHTELPRCDHLGARLLPPLAPDRLREWYQCEAGHGVVCPCGLCQRCADHSAHPGHFRWAEPPPLVLRPQSSSVVVTVAVGERARELHAITGPTQAGYARAIGADYLVITDATQSWPLAEKFRVAEVVGAYERTLYLDVDVVVRASAPSIWDELPPGSIGIHDDTPWVKLDLFVAEKTRIARALGQTPFLDGVWNSGVVVCSRDQESLWQFPAAPIPISHCAEQHVVELNCRRGAWPIKHLDRRWNWQWWIDRECRHLDGVYMAHLAGLGQDNWFPPEASSIWRPRLARLLAAS